MLLAALEDGRIAVELLRSFVRVKPLGGQILCELATQAWEIYGYWFAKSPVFAQIALPRPCAFFPEHHRFPSEVQVRLWVRANSISEHTCTCLPEASDLAQNGASALALHMRLMRLQIKQKEIAKRAVHFETRPCTPCELWDKTPCDWC